MNGMLTRHRGGAGGVVLKERVFLKHAPKIIVNLTEELHPRPTLSRLFEFLASPNYEHGASKRWHLMPIYDQLGTSAVAAHALRKTREGQELLPRLLRWLGESAEVLAGHSFGTVSHIDFAASRDAVDKLR